MRNDELVFQRIYEVYQPKLLRYVTYLIGEEGAEDLTQEIFVKVHQALDHFRGDAKLSTWLYRIATNAALDKMRSPAVRRATASQTPEHSFENVDDNVEDQDAWTGEKAVPVEHQVFRKEMNACIMDFIKKLPEHYRTVLVLGEFEGMRNKELSEVLGITVDTAKIRLHRGRALLAKELRTNCASYWIEGNEFLPEIRRKKK